MNNKNNAELCASLNFSFDEANELFCEESLNSMQCAKVNGGTPGWILALKEFARAVGVALSVESIKGVWDSVFGKTSPTPAAAQINSTTVTKTSQWEITVTLFNVDITIFGLEINNEQVTSTTMSPTQ